MNWSFEPFSTRGLLLLAALVGLCRCHSAAPTADQSFRSPSTSGASAKTTPTPATSGATTSSDPQLIFSNASINQAAGACGALTVGATNVSGISAAVAATPLVVQLSSSSATGAFFSDAACAAALTAFSLPALAQTATAYYRDSAAGAPTLTATDTVSKILAPVHQTETIGNAVSTGPAPYSPGTFLVGYNDAWFLDYFISSLAANPAHDIPTSNFDLDYLKATFAGIKKAGGSIVRFWIVMDQEGLILASTYPQTQGVSAEMLKNLESVLQVAQANNLLVYFTLLEMGPAGEQETNRELDYYVNVLNNKHGEGDAFNQKAVVPILKLVNAYQSSIFGIDLFNEIQFLVDSGVFTNGWTSARTWMKSTRDFIKSQAPWVKVTSTSSADYITQGKFSGIGLDFYDVHDYSDSVNVAHYNAVCAKAQSDGVPMILGEYGQGSPQIDNSLQTAATASFLAAASGSCFSAALGWRFEGYDQWSYFYDTGLRPAAAVVQSYAAIATKSTSQGSITVTRCGNISPSDLIGYWPQPGAQGCHTTKIGAVADFPQCQVDDFVWAGAIIEERWGCGKPTESGFYTNGTKNGQTLYQKQIWAP